MSIEKFITLSKVVHNGLLYVELKVEHALPTPLQWRFAVEEVKDELQHRVEEDIPFALILDLTQMGFLPLGNIREFVEILEKQYVILEKRLVATSVITEGTLIGALFEIMKKFYKTKKPLKFVKNLEEARGFVCENLEQSS